MTVIDDLVAEAVRLDSILSLLTEAQWLADSAADGWSVADGGAWGKGPKTVNHPHQVGLGELLSMASTRLQGEVGGPIGLTRDGAAVWRP